MGSDLDYSPQVMQKALHILVREAIVGAAHQKKFEEMLARIDTFMQQNNKGQRQEQAQPMELDGTVAISSALDEPEHSEEEYISELKAIVFDAYSMMVEGEDKYDHHYDSTIATSANTNPKKMVRLSQVKHHLIQPHKHSPNTHIQHLHKPLYGIIIG